MNLNTYLKQTAILDYNHPDIEDLVIKNQWDILNTYDKIGAAYGFVKDEIVFGYNASDDLPASRVLADGYGQCNTKSSLLMALLRRLGIPCRFHGFTINNNLQKGAIPDYLFFLAPDYIIHSWVEILFEGRWINLEGFILDESYLSSVQNRFSSISGSFCGYGIATPCLKNPEVNWNGNDTYIQKDGIHDDFGVYDDPDIFYITAGTNLSGIKKFLFIHLFRHLMNLNVKQIRTQAIIADSN